MKIELTKEEVGILLGALFMCRVADTFMTKKTREKSKKIEAKLADAIAKEKP